MIDSELNRRIIALAPKFQASDYAPSTFEALKEQSTGSPVVWSGASDATIYGAASVNHAFRAWHDSLHLKLNAPFNMHGERIVALEQARLIGSDTYGHLIIAEVIGQAEHYALTGQFPTDQKAFVIEYLRVLNKKN
jgi:hypothetical protein